MKIHRATINELEPLTELFNLYRVFYEQESNLEGARNFLEERLLNGDSVVFIAYDGKVPVGFVQMYPSFSSVSMKRSWILNDLFVSGAARNKGFGEKLVKKAIEFVHETGAKGVLLETGQDNLAAQRLYERIGFKKEVNYFYYFSI